MTGQVFIIDENLTATAVKSALPNCSVTSDVVFYTWLWEVEAESVGVDAPRLRLMTQWRLMHGSFLHR